MNIRIGMALLCFGLGVWGSLLQAEENQSGLPPLVLLIPSRQAVISAKVETSVKTYFFEEGQTVKQGQRVVELDKEPFVLQKNVLSARLSETRVQEKHYNLEYERFKKLFAKATVPETKYEEMKFKRDQSVERIQNLESMIKVIELDIKYCDIPAPFNGRLVKMIAHQHEFLEVGDPIFKLINDEKLHAVVHFKSSLIHTIKKGQLMKIEINETGLPYMAKIIKIGADIDPESRTFRVVGELHNRNGKLKAGMFGSCLEIEKASK